MVDIKSVPQEEMVKKDARENFCKGLNCAEPVYTVLCNAGLVDFPKETVALATGFGGGIGLNRSVCGSLAAAMAVDMIHQGANEGFNQPFGKNMAGKQ